MVPTVNLPADLGRRLRAARGYAGGISRGELAQRIGWKSATTFQRIEDGARDFDPIELEAVLPKIADICGLPHDFFTADWTHVGQASEDDEPQWVGRLDRKLDLVLDTVRGGVTRRQLEELLTDSPIVDAAVQAAGRQPRAQGSSGSRRSA